MTAVIQPAGTVTLVFTDIEGSTRLLEELGVDAYRDALAEHRRVVRDACARHAGYEVDYEGDAFFYAFSSAQQAVSAVAETMVGLQPGPIRIRVGVHTGEPALDRPKYVGMDVHRAARIMSTAHGGQVVLSPSTVGLLEAGSVELKDLGQHRMKDLSSPIPLHQLLIAGLPDVFPPLKTLYRSNLPVPATPFLGREAELAEVTQRLTDPNTRLLTLTGPGGTGKTRLALQAAAEAADLFPDGVFWVPLAPLRDPGLLLPAVAQALDVKERVDEQLAVTVARILVGKQALVLLDNAEHLLPAAARDVAALTDACPTLRLLVTSRERLQIGAETVWPVPTMDASDGELLFVERARAAGVELAVDETVAELCRRLDELPLAIQLAAARTRSLSPVEILDRLDQRLSLLTSRAQDVDERQRTLEATIAWSYELLDSDEQRVLRALSVFAGGCTLDAAEHVADADLDLLESLLDKSLLGHRVDDAGQSRYWMLETIREYARERLQTSGEADDLYRAHAEFCSARLGPLGMAVRRYDETATAVLEADLDNARVAIATALDTGDVASVARLLNALWAFWLMRGLNREGMAAVEQYLSLDRTNLDPATRLEGDTAASEILRFSGEPARARELKRACLELTRQHPDLELPLSGGIVRRLTMAMLADLADVELQMGEIDVARTYAAESLELRRADGVPFGIAHALGAVALVERVAERFDDAAACCAEAADLLESVESPEAHSARVAQGELELLCGRPSDAVALLVLHLPGIAGGGPQESVYGLSISMQVLAAYGRHADVLILGRTANALLQETGLVLPPWDMDRLETTISVSRAQPAALPDDDTTAPLPADAALALALDTLRELASFVVPTDRAPRR